MAREIVTIRVELDQESDSGLRKWSKEEARSKRRQAALMLQRLVKIRKEQPQKLKDMGL